MGTSLLWHAEEWLVSEDVQFLQVKTLAASRKNPCYQETRAFYRKVGFVPLEVFEDLWSEANPCLMLIKNLSSWQIESLESNEPIPQ